MPNVLVFPAGSEIGLEIERSLRHIRTLKVFGASSVPDHANYAFEFTTKRLPFFNDANFASELLEVINDCEIDFIFPAHDDLVELLPKLKKDGLIPSHVEIIGSAGQTAWLARSKRATYNKLSSVISTPIEFTPNEVRNDTLPVFAKPDRGQGSKGARKISRLEDIVGIPDSTIITEYLPGEEYTVDCFTDRHGRLRFSGGRLRSRTSNGISVSSIEHRDPEFHKIAMAINGALDFRGMWFFQLKRRSDGTLVLLEIAPRVSGGMGFFRVKGINLPLLALYDRMNLDITIFSNSIDVIRDCALAPKYSINFLFSDVYIDLDDTLIFGSKTNADLIGLLYHWKNRKKTLHLITRHRAVHGRDPRNTLRSHDIAESLFSSIIEIAANQVKSSFIKQIDSIFIDDSSSERLDVHEVCGIPTFTCQQACELFARSKGNF